MGLLDDLKQQADSVLVKEQTSQEALNSKLQAAHTRLKEALQYWVQFFQSLNVVKPPIRRSYYIEGTSQLENLIQCDYNVNGRRLTVDHHDYIDAIVLAFRCASATKLTIEKESAALVDRLREHLWSHGLKFDVREMRREGAYVDRGVFSVTSEVPVTITIAADIDNTQIKVTVRNLERLGEYTNIYDYDELGNELLEEIGKAILAKPNNLRKFGRRQAATAAALRGKAKQA